MEKQKKKIRDFSWDDYGISKNRHKELKYFCLQYDEKKSQIRYGAAGMKYDGMPHASEPGSPTEQGCLSNLAIQHDCEMIEQAAIAANPEIYQYIIKSVTYDLPYEFIEYDERLGRIPVGKTDFYGYRRLFYYNLHKLKIGDKLSRSS